MSLESAGFIHQLNPNNPSGADRVKDGDDHIRLIKATLQATFPNVKGEVSLTHEFLNSLKSLVVPVGSITLFYGDTAPAGWGICNGATYNKVDGTGTIVSPDLRGRVAVGVSDSHAFGTKWGQESRTVTSEPAGAHAHTASSADAGGHTHTLSGTSGNSTTGVSPNFTTKNDTAGGGTGKTVASPMSLNDTGHTHSISGTADSSGTHSHAITVAEGGAHSHSVAVDVTQPSIALHYIIKL